MSELGDFLRERFGRHTGFHTAGRAIAANSGGIDALAAYDENVIPAEGGGAEEMHFMGIFAIVMQYAFSLLPSIVLGVQTLEGDVKAGADKQKDAEDMLGVALQGATAAIPAGSANSALSQLAATAVLGIIKTTGAIGAAVTHTKATGQYQAATTKSVEIQAAVKAATPAAALTTASAFTPAQGSALPQPAAASRV